MLINLTALPLIGMPGIWEWILIVGAILLLFGATKLPKLGKGLGEGIRNFKTGIKGENEQEEKSIVVADEVIVSDTGTDNA